MIVSKQSLVHAAAQNIVDAAQLQPLEAAQSALLASAEMLYGHLAESNETDQIEILARIRDTVNREIESDALRHLPEDRQFGKLMAYFARGFVDASQTMGLADVDHDAMRMAVADAMACGISYPHAAQGH